MESWPLLFNNKIIIIINYSDRSDFIQSVNRAWSEPAAKFEALQINLSLNICLVSSSDVMEHFAFPGNIDFAADGQGAF